MFFLGFLETLMALGEFLKVGGIPIGTQQKREDNYAGENVSGDRAFPKTHSSPDCLEHTYA
jgi:hypothetical protein